MFTFPRFLRVGVGILLIGAIFLSGWIILFDNKSEAKTNNASIKTVNHKSNAVAKKTESSNSNEQKTETDQKTKPVDWSVPSGGAYPVLAPNEDIWIKVSKAKQKVYIMNGNKPIYTMVCSTGLDTSPDTSTPEGTFYIQQERGESFYNPNEQEGAKYWVSWKNHGEFLFHSVATDKNGNVIPSEAEKLGQKASHGCVRLAMPDAKWIYDNIKYNTKVVIS